MESLWQDIRFATRVLAKNPGFTAVAVVVLALGIGANAATFTLTNALLLKPIQAESPEDLVAVYSKDTERPDTYRAFSYPNFRDLRELNTTFVDLMAHDFTIAGIRQGEVTQRVFAEIVSSNYFDVFGAVPFRGRFFTAEEELPDAAIPVAIVSHQYWRRHGEDPDMIGKIVEVNGRQLEIVGITSPGFTGRTAMMAPLLYLPLGMHGQLMSNAFTQDGRPLDDRENHRLLVVGRLNPDTSHEAADAQLATVAARLEEQFPAINERQTFIVGPLSRLSISTSPDNDRGQLAMVASILMGMTGVVLLLACINLANMLLARGEVRRKEFAIRAAIGGGRMRIVRQLLTEGLLLSALGGIAGLAAGWWVNGLLSRSMNNVLAMNGLSFDIVVRSGPDLRVLLATIGFCTLGTVLFALGPALQQTRLDVMEDLKQKTSEGGRTGRRGLFSRRNLLVGSQMALSLVLLVAAGLFIRAAYKAANVDPGFDLDHGLLVEVDPSFVGYDDARSQELYRELYDRLGAIPGIDGVGVAATVPFGSVSMGKSVRRAGDLPAPGESEVEAFSATQNIVGTGYFDALGVRLVSGRDFSREETDADSDNKVVIVDELLAAKLWPGEDVVGRRVAYGRVPDDDNRQEFEIVGVVATVHDDLFPAEPSPHVYQPFGQAFQAGMNVHLRTATADAAAQADLMRAVRQEIHAVDARVPVITMRSLRDHLAESFSLWMVRLGATIFTLFGALALFLAVVGVYGVKAYMVAQRTREIGIRKALGATARNTLGLIVRESLAVTVTGLGVGLLLSVAVGRVLGNLLYEVSGLDPLTFLVAPLVLLSAALAATLVPAQRAASVEPVIALRQE